MFARAQAQGHEFTEGFYLDQENIDEINHLYSTGNDLTDLHQHKQKLEQQQKLIQATINLKEQQKNKEKSEELRANIKAEILKENEELDKKKNEELDKKK